MNSRPITAAAPASPAASPDKRARRPAITASTFEPDPAPPARTDSTRNSGLPSLSPYRRSASPGSSSRPASPSASTRVSSRPSRSSATSSQRPSACSAVTSSLTGPPASISSRRAVAATRSRGRVPQQVVQEPQGLGVAPLQVVGDEQQRRGQGARDRVEQPPPLLALGQRVRRRAQLGQQAGELAAVGGVEVAQRAPRSARLAATRSPARRRRPPRPRTNAPRR